MARRNRRDEPGAVHHVFNRGIARRTIFENREDYRAFLAYLAKEIRRGELEVLAFCLMQNHYHLLVRSKKGNLGAAMQRIQTTYARRFNRLRHRDGPLFRSRYGSKRTESEFYIHAAYHYIERNAVEAGLVEAPSDYEFCSAAFRESRRPPRWLSDLADRLPSELDETENTAIAFMIEGAMRGQGRDHDVYNVRWGSSEGVAEWFQRKALNAGIRRQANGTSLTPALLKSALKTAIRIQMSRFV